MSNTISGQLYFSLPRSRASRYLVDETSSSSSRYSSRTSKNVRGSGFGKKIGRARVYEFERLRWIVIDWWLSNGDRDLINERRVLISRRSLINHDCINLDLDFAFTFLCVRSISITFALNLIAPNKFMQSCFRKHDSDKLQQDDIVFVGFGFIRYL